MQIHIFKSSQFLEDTLLVSPSNKMNLYGCINKMNLYGCIAEMCENHKDAQLIELKKPKH